jgi:hypothetical protein
MPQKLSENMQICLGGSVILQPSVQVQSTISGDFFLDLLEKQLPKWPCRAIFVILSKG